MRAEQIREWCFDQHLVGFSRCVWQPDKHEWKETYRWVRRTKKILNEEMNKRQVDFATYGSTMLPEMKKDILDQMINPPLLLEPGMEP